MYTARLLFSEYLRCGWLPSSYEVPPEVTPTNHEATRRRTQQWWYCEGSPAEVLREVLRRYSV